MISRFWSESAEPTCVMLGAEPVEGDEGQLEGGQSQRRQLPQAGQQVPHSGKVPVLLIAYCIGFSAPLIFPVRHCLITLS